MIVDIVPNHSSSEHPWFRNALADASHPDRRRYVFRPGRNGGPPNNWPGNWGGPAWTLDEASGEWYLHLFAPEQPDLNWHEPQVQEDFEGILRFWLDRGVDGFRIDVGHALFKDAELRDEPDPNASGRFSSDWRTAIDQPEVHPLYRRWRRLVDGYGDERVLVGEVVFSDPRRIAPYVRLDELHLSFNFALLFRPWDAGAIREAVDSTLAALAEVGATATWVLENHDVTRLPSRYGGGEDGRRRARAATLLLLALPGTAFLYQGQELGLEEVDLPHDARLDPIFRRSGGARAGRDGCRVPVPWSREGAAYGFTTGTPWLPMPAEWAEASVAAQQDDDASALALHRAALHVRRGNEALRQGSFAWLDGSPGALVFRRETSGEALVCAVNVDAEPFAPPQGELLLPSEPGLGRAVPPGAAVWIRPKERR